MAWGAPWLTNCEDPHVKSLMIMGMEDLRVEALINHATMSWNQDILAAYFLPNEVSTINRIPIAHAGGEDKLIWSKNKSRAYSVRSGYYTLMEEIADGSHLKVEGPWKKMWAAKVPQKYKLLLWCAMRNVLPTRQNLRRKGVNCSTACPHCEITDENTWHALYWCPKAKECWETGGLWEVMRDMIENAEGFFEASCELITKMTATQLKEFFCLLWCIWRRRNDKVWKGVELNVRTAVEMSKEFMHGWCKVREGKDDSSWHISSNSDLIWKKPIPGSFKCNTDAALFMEEGRFGVGLCVRDSNGAFHMAKMMWFPGSPTPKEADAIALPEAIKWVQEEGLPNMCFELDCKGVVDDILNEQFYTNEVGSILDKCRERLKLLQN